ncbi:MAG: hypothetical protein K2H36_02275 [Clostridia bacterium]|nr:hypothetical protein [Clostridia bacterium]MDE6758372.1 hypothetical protein [Clostridia bacterium]
MEENTHITKKTKIIIAAAVSVAVLIVAIVCGIVFSRKERELTTQEWLDKFSLSMESALSVKDEDGNVLPVNVMREIEIEADGSVVATYRQSLQTFTVDGQVEAYLLSEEKYPALESEQDNVTEEYYLYQNVMYTSRLCAGEKQISHFDSNVDTLLQVAKENIGENKYNFDEGNFSPIEEGAGIVAHEKDVHRICAKIATDKYAAFFGKDVEGLSNMTVTMQMNGDVFEYFTLEYEENGIKTKVKITRYDAKTVTKPQWLE